MNEACLAFCVYYVDIVCVFSMSFAVEKFGSDLVLNEDESGHVK